MNLNELKELYTRRQSCRSFDPSRPVPEALLREICGIALLAPSACNSQPWKLYAVTGAKAKELCLGVQEGGSNKFASDTPAFVAVAENESELAPRVRERYSNREWIEYDVGNLTAHLLLAAEAAGLSTCVLGMRNEEMLRRTLNLTNGEKIPYLVAVGYATEDYEIRKKTRKDISETLVFLR